MAPKSQENLHIPDTEKVESKKSIRTRDKFIGAGAAAALALGLAACGPGEEEVSAGPAPTETAVEEPIEVNDPTNPEAGEAKEWGKFELPEPERNALYDFGSKEDFLNWFEIDADTYTTPEDIAKKHVMNLEGLINAGFSYQLDIELSHEPDYRGGDSMLSPNQVAAAHEAYDIPIMQRIATPSLDMGELIDYDYKLERASLFIISNFIREDHTPYAMSQEYYDSTVLSMNADQFSDSTEFTVEIHNGDSDNGLMNTAEWARQSGQPAQLGVDYIDHVTFVLDEETNSWLVSERKNISEERNDTP